jgi:predicted transcriptional regulator
VSNIVDKLAECEKKIRSLQQEKARQDGRKQQLMDRLKSEFGMDSLEQAVIELGKLQTEVEGYEKDLKEIVESMEGIISKSRTK